MVAKGNSLLFHYRFVSSFFSFDGAVFHNHQNSRTNHYITTLANFNDSPLAVGDWTGSGHSEAEVFNIAAKIWTEVAKYPYHPE